MLLPSRLLWNASTLPAVNGSHIRRALRSGRRVDSHDFQAEPQSSGRANSQSSTPCCRGRPPVEGLPGVEVHDDRHPRFIALPGLGVRVLGTSQRPGSSRPTPTRRSRRRTRRPARRERTWLVQMYTSSRVMQEAMLSSFGGWSLAHVLEASCPSSSDQPSSDQPSSDQLGATGMEGLKQRHLSASAPKC